MGNIMGYRRRCDAIDSATQALRALNLESCAEPSKLYDGWDPLFSFSTTHEIIEFNKRMELKNRINSALSSDLSPDNFVEEYNFDYDHEDENGNPIPLPTRTPEEEVELKNQLDEELHLISLGL